MSDDREYYNPYEGIRKSLSDRRKVRSKRIQEAELNSHPDNDGTEIIMDGSRKHYTNLKNITAAHRVGKKGLKSSYEPHQIFNGLTQTLNYKWDRLKKPTKPIFVDGIQTIAKNPVEIVPFKDIVDMHKPRRTRKNTKKNLNIRKNIRNRRR